ncbi:MAG: PAS domain S-box protein [candidate division Zixibacteria bacterium]|nr:PAS domain S-box protein [candidate division Zixibacteria bacterium]
MDKSSSMIMTEKKKKIQQNKLSGSAISMTNSTKSQTKITLKNTIQPDPGIKDKYLALLRNTNDAFGLHQIITDSKNKPIDYIFLEVNDRFEQFTGLKKDNILGKRVSEIFPAIQESKPNLVELFGNIALNGQNETIEYYHKPANKWFNVLAFRVTKGYFITLFNEITDHKRALDVAEKSENRYRAAIHASKNILYEWNAKSNHTTFLGNSKRILGYEPEELDGDLKHWMSLVHPNDISDLSEQIEETSETLEPGHFEFRLRKKNGDYIFVEAPGQFLLDKEGKLDRRIGFIKDITKRKQIMHNLQNTQESLIIEQVALRQKNVALKEVLTQIENEKKQIKRQIQNNIERIVFPILETLKNRGGSSETEYFELLENSLKDISEPFVSSLLLKDLKLSPRELEICNMIKNGMSSQNIATALNVSIHTIHTQRARIRKKLKISGHNENLASFFSSNQ